MGGFSTAVPGPTNQGYAITPPDPYANLRALAMQGQIAQQRQALVAGQQQMQTTALNQQILQQQLDDQKALVQTFKDGVDPNKPDDIINGIIKNGGSGPTAIKFVQEIANTRQINAKTQSDILANQKQSEDHYRATIDGITKLPPEQQQAAWNEHRQEILAVDPGAPELYPGNDIAKARSDTHALQSQLIDEELKKRETEKNVAQAGQAKAETEKLNLINKRLQQGGHVVQPGEPHPIDGIFPPSLDPAQNQYFKAAYDAGAQFINPTTGISEVQQDVIKRATDAASKIREAQNPQIIAGKAATSKAEEIATAPIKTKVAVDTQRALNSTAAVGNVPPHLIPQYQGEVAKVASAYGDAANAANEMQEMIDLMRGGNKIAYAYSPTTGVLTINSANGTKRVNTTEIAQYAGAGNLLDKVTGFFGKQLTGASVPSDIVDAMEQVHGTLGEGSRNSAVAKIKSLNAQYGATTDPDAILVRPNKATAGTRGGSLPRVATPADVAKLPKGTHFLDPNGIERIRP